MTRALLAMIRFYRRHISPCFPRTCKYYPTCSAYAIAAIARHGAFKGLAYSLWRILRCNPFSQGGYDPVPQRAVPRRYDKTPLM